jgi:UPF0716 family protein affecting phage T7 exclusion
MTFAIPTWLLWVGGAIGGVALLVALAVLILFACLGYAFYKAFSRHGIWR